MKKNRSTYQFWFSFCRNPSAWVRKSHGHGKVNKIEGGRIEYVVLCKTLEYPVNLKSSKDLRMAKFLITQYGGPDGELSAAL